MKRPGGSKRKKSRKGDKKALIFPMAVAAAALLAFAIRVQVCRELLHADPNVANPSPVTDMATYKTLAAMVVEKKFEGAYYYQPFYYAVFLPAIELVFGDGPWPVMLVQCLLSAATVVLAALSARILRGNAAGIIAAFLAALSSTLALYVPYLLIATLQTFWMALILYLCLDIIKKRRSPSRPPEPLWNRCVDWARVGLILGFAILTRGNAWLLLPGVLLAALYAETHSRLYDNAETASKLLKSALPAAVLVAFVLIPQIPFAWRNTAVTGRLSMASTAANSVLCLGNTPEAPPGGRDPGTGPGPMEYPETLKLWTSDTTPVWKHILEWASERPASFLELQFRKLLLFWDYREIPNNVAIEAQGIASPTLRTFGLIPVFENPKTHSKRIPMNLVPFSLTTLLLALAATIFLTTRLLLKTFRHGPRRAFAANAPTALLLYFLAVAWVGVSGFYVLARFRAPAIPIFCVLAGCFVSILLAAFKKKLAKTAVASLAMVPLSLFVVLQGYDTYRFDLEKRVMRVIRPDGVLARANNGKTILTRDNGPFSFGSWNFHPLTPGDKIIKTFVLPAGSAEKSSAEVALDIVWLRPAYLTLKINGVKKTFHPKSNRPGKETRAFRVELPKDGTIEIEVLHAPEKAAMFALDTQRSYGRTTLNGEKIDAELVARLKLTKKEHVP